FRPTASAVTAARDRRFRFVFGGSAGIRGQATFETASAILSAGKKRKLPLGSAAFAIPADGKVAVKVRLSAGAFAALKRHRKLRVKATLRSNGRSFTRTFTLRAPR
ncbi:MAG: hypothetical protein M3340_11490, partial [Actinomycetota bacterium]|nr:hypothetical protein [Actinomycetota bacterium]